MDQIVADGGEAVFIAADVSVTTEVASLIGRTVETFGRLDCAFNNAGVGQGSQPLPELPEEVWHRVIAINLTSVYLCLKYEIAQMLTQGGGSIVEHVLWLRVGRRTGQRGVCRRQTWRGGADQNSGAGVGDRGHSRQRSLSWLDPDAHGGPVAGRSRAT